MKEKVEQKNTKNYSFSQWNISYHRKLLRKVINAAKHFTTTASMRFSILKKLNLIGQFSNWLEFLQNFEFNSIFDHHDKKNKLQVDIVWILVQSYIAIFNQKTNHAIYSQLGDFICLVFYMVQTKLMRSNRICTIKLLCGDNKTKWSNRYSQIRGTNGICLE